MAFLLRAAGDFATQGIDRIERLITDNAFAYRRCAALKHPVTQLGARHMFIKPHCPLQNGKVCEDLARRCTGSV